MIARLFPLLLISSLAAQGPATVRTVNPTAATEAQSYDLPGRTEPFEQAHLFSRATGVVKERFVDIGDRVKQDEVLAEIEVPELVHQRDQARAIADQAIARAETARLAAERAASLLDTKAISLEESEQRASAEAEAGAAARAAEAEVRRLDALIGFATLRAPFPATIAARRIDRGDFLRGNGSGIEEWAFHLVRLDKLRFAVAGTPDIALRVEPGTPAVVEFPEFPGRSFPAKVSRSSDLFDPASGTMRVELLLENPDFELPAGLSGSAVFKLDPAPGTWLVPTNTLILRDGKSMVGLVKDGKFTLIDVLPGRNLGDRMEMVSTGLAADSAVIVSPNGMLVPGQEVVAQAAEGKK
ncbi:MAG: efflux RND transporter periplasmic adaptor subunit [Akkermansiaceae bacterium]|jgi:RND family efflux transporter MFP subunit|nr:efflux RND transporter periplasmic adaptor subunit [Akkermansiaceae bacterium]